MIISAFTTSPSAQTLTVWCECAGAGRVSGTVEPIVASEDNSGDEEIDLNANVFVDNTVGNNIAKNYVPAIQKGFEEACEVGPLTGHPVQGVRFELKDGTWQCVCVGVYMCECVCTCVRLSCVMCNLGVFYLRARGCMRVCHVQYGCVLCVGGCERFLCVRMRVCVVSWCW